MQTAGKAPSTLTALVDDAHHGQRLDKALLLCAPAASLRARRRMCAVWDVQVDGVTRAAAYKVRKGQRIVARPPAFAVGEEARHAPAPNAGGAWLVGISPPWAALSKPHGLHTQRLAGGGEPSLEEQLAGLMGARDAPSACPWRVGQLPAEGWRLVTRLDGEVSGVVLAAQNDIAEKRFRKLESQGDIVKEYVCLTVGFGENYHSRRGETWEIRNAIDMSNRKKVVVAPHEADDPARWTSVTLEGPVAACGGTSVWRTRVRIRRGARHQIRAHLAFVGLPILGDTRYGDGGGMVAEWMSTQEQGLLQLPEILKDNLDFWGSAAPRHRLYLHCRQCRVEAFEATVEPEWGLEWGECGARD